MNDTFAWDSASLAGVMIDAAFIAAEVLAAGMSLWLGLRLFRSEEKLFGLLPTIGILLILVCPIGLEATTSLILGSMITAEIFSALGYVLVTTLLAIMIYIFYRTAFRRSPRPNFSA